MSYSIKKMGKTTSKLIGYVGVDAGMLIVTDPGYLNYWVDNNVGDEGAGHYSWAGACATTDDDNLKGGSLNFSTGQVGQGVVFRSGLGDGYYPVIGHYAEVDGWGERIVKVEIVFVEEK